jgi:hypothetical protein
VIQNLGPACLEHMCLPKSREEIWQEKKGISTLVCLLRNGQVAKTGGGFEDFRQRLI